MTLMVFSKQFEYLPEYPNANLLGHKTFLLRRALLQRGVQIDIPKVAQAERSIAAWSARYGDRIIVFRGSMPAHSTFKAHKTVKNKAKAKEILDRAGVRVPQGIVVDANDNQMALDWFQNLSTKKAVLKPINGSLGNGIVTGISNEDSLLMALKNTTRDRVILEEHIEGEDHRFLVVGGEVRAVMRRDRAYVRGNGIDTVETLVRMKNEERAKVPFNQNHPLVLDEAALKLLAEQGLGKNSVLTEGESARLRSVSNIGAGGDSVDVTDEVHSGFLRMAERAAGAIGNLDCCGVDFLIEEVSKAPESQDWSIMEINANADIPIHHWPSQGISRDVAADVARYYFPEVETPKVEAKIIKIKGKVRNAGMEDWIARTATISGLGGKFVKSEKQTLEFKVEGTSASIEFFTSKLSKPTKTSIVESISIESETPEGAKFFLPLD